MGVPFSRGDFLYYNGSTLRHFDKDWELIETLSLPINGFSPVIGWDYNLYGMGFIGGSSYPKSPVVYQFPKDGSDPFLVTTLPWVADNPFGFGIPYMCQDLFSGSGYYVQIIESIDREHSNIHIFKLDNDFNIVSDTTYPIITVETGLGAEGIAQLADGSVSYITNEDSSGIPGGGTQTTNLSSAGSVLVPLTPLALDVNLGSVWTPGSSLVTAPDNTFIYISRGGIGSGPSLTWYGKVAKLTTTGVVWSTTIFTSPVLGGGLLGNPIIDVDGVSCWAVYGTSSGLTFTDTAYRLSLVNGAILETQPLGSVTYDNIDDSAPGFNLRFLVTYLGDHLECSGGVEIGDLPEQLQVVFIEADGGDLYQLGDGNVVSAHPAPGTSHWHVTTTDGSTPLYVIVGTVVYPIVAGLTTSVVAFSAARTPVTVVTTLAGLESVYETVLIVPALASWRLQRFDTKVRMEERA